MRTDHLSRNDLSPDAYAWYLRYLSAIDRKDLRDYGALLAEDCEMYMNNDGPVRGKDAILGMLGPYWQSFESVEHDLLAIVGNDDGWALEALNHYRRLDGSEVTVRAVAVTERDASGLVRSARVYSDTAPVFSTQGAA